MTSNNKSYYWPIAIAIIFTLIFMFLGGRYQLNHDVGGQISVSETYLSGVSINDEFANRETPLAIMMYMVPLLMKENIPYLGITSSVIIFICILLNLSAFISYKILKNTPIFSEKKTILIFFLNFYYALTIYSNYRIFPDFGQREHLAAIFLTPYLLSIIAITYNVKLNKKIRFIIAIFATLGFCIKPHFVLFFIFSELFLTIRTKNLFSWIRIESLIPIGLGILYVFIWRLFFTSYFEEILNYSKIITNVESTFSAPVVVSCIIIMLIPICLFTYSIFSKTKRDRSLFLYCFLLCSAAGIIYVVQSRGYSHHAYLIVFFTYFMTAICFRNNLIMNLMLFILIPVIYIHGFGTKLLNDKETNRDSFLEVSYELSEYVKDRKVTVLSATMYPTWPLLNISGAKYYSPVRNLFYLVGPYRRYNDTEIKPELLKPEERFFQEKIISFFQKKKPELVLVMNDTGHIPTGKIDIIRSLKMDPRFTYIWAGYKPIKQFNFYPKENVPPTKLYLFERINTE